jgi:hypothetical protein
MIIKNIFTGANHWKSWERAVWSMSMISSVLWIIFIVITEIFMFQGKPVRDYVGEYDKINNARGFNERMLEQDRLSRMSPTERASFRNGINSKNEERQLTIKHNNGYLLRGLSKAFGIPVAWFGILLTFFTFVGKFESSNSD